MPMGANLPGLCAGAVPCAVSIGCMSTRLLSAAEVADLLGVPRSWVYEQSRQGRIPTVALGRYRRFRQEAIETWIELLEADRHRRAA